MVGANPKSRTVERTARVSLPGAPSHDGAFAVWHRAGSHRWRWIAVLSVFVPLSFVLVQCGKAPSAGMLAANAATGDTFEDRFPAPQFKDRFPTESESFQQRPAAGPRAKTAQAEPAPYRVASLAPTVPYERPVREEQTTLVGLKSSAFPYLGNNPRTDEPFLNISRGERRGHRGLGGRVFWQDETFNDNRVLMHVPESFDARKPGVIVVFFHGNGATLERDVRDRQLVPQQISDSGVNAVLLAPQLAVDAADSSPGNFWKPGHFAAYVDEAAERLMRLYGDRAAGRQLNLAPVVVVAYSGGYLPAAYALDRGGAPHRVKGVILLDALYGDEDKYAAWMAARRRQAFLLSAYTDSTKDENAALQGLLDKRRVPYAKAMPSALHPGTVAFVPCGGLDMHGDFVTRAWRADPLKAALAMIPGYTPVRDKKSV